MQQMSVLSDQAVPMVKDLKALTDAKGMTMQLDYAQPAECVMGQLQG
jgi:hypothetical protein